MKIFDIFKKTKTAKKEEKVRPKAEKTVEPKATEEKPGNLKLKSETGVSEKVVKEKHKKNEDTKDAYKILIKPLVTERATALAALNKYCFMVANDANKITVKKAIKSLYGVEPINVNIIKVRGKRVSYRRASGKKKNWKKAIVTLKIGEKIEIYEGV